jgi:hypothetical protein
MSIEFSPDNGASGVAASPFTSVQGAADAAQDAGEGARFLGEFWVEQGVCFTSGHGVNALREARGRGLMVNQRPTGQALTDYFESGDMPAYDDGAGCPVRPLRKLRYTERTDTRTPVGTGVYVYGPTEDEIDCFEFEIDIASAPMVDDGMGGQTSAATALLNATPTTAPGSPVASPIPPVQPSGTVAVAHGKMVPGNPLAVVHSDGRLCVPRIAMEALAFETGEAITGGEPLYVTTSGKSISISQDAASGGVASLPTTDRLRLHLTIPGAPVVQGTEYGITVGSALTIDLDSPNP